MFILGVNTGHDACAVLYEDYRLVAAVPLERLTRKKSDGGRYPQEAINEALDTISISRDKIDTIAISRSTFPPSWMTRLPRPIRKFSLRRRERKRAWIDAAHGEVKLIEAMKRLEIYEIEDLVDKKRFLKETGFAENKEIFFFNHHFAHALGALFHTDWSEALIYTADGGGDDVFYSHLLLKSGVLKRLHGDEGETWAENQSIASSMGELYYMTTKYLNFIPNRHEGKVLGLAAFGKPVLTDWFKRLYHIDRNGRIAHSLYPSRGLLRWLIKYAVARHPREDVAASVQKALEDLEVEAVGRLVEQHKVRRLAVSGGVFANVLLNQKLAETLALDEIFIYPAMSDQGLAAGGVLEYLLARDGLEVWLKQRYRFTDLYLGRNYDADIATAMTAAGARPISCPDDDYVQETVRQIIDGKVVAIYRGRMEYGPRALGARSILAAATDRRINDWLNKRLSRTEFMPFAPVVRAERARDVFVLPASMEYAARFMTITCAVREEWREKIPGVVHVDGTARPQVIEREANPLYYDILAAYEQATGLPVLINTSFNAHEEPIINTPAECAAALMAGRVDAVVTEKGLWRA